MPTAISLTFAGKLKLLGKRRRVLISFLPFSHFHPLDEPRSRCYSNPTTKKLRTRYTTCTCPHTEPLPGLKFQRPSSAGVTRDDFPLPSLFSSLSNLCVSDLKFIHSPLIRISL
ncbi:unnamed protein product [Citrullus colocynthis]|uniref:Uncharacterized protein n=1 Tax=Citrullus colocynthis TaxID=252529 RepID=A0ABP0YLM5_9ROSI